MREARGDKNNRIKVNKFRFYKLFVGSSPPDRQIWIVFFADHKSPRMATGRVDAAVPLHGALGSVSTGFCGKK
jgi:hypothetical protein